MSHTSIASTSHSSSSSSYNIPHDHQKLDIKSVKSLVSLINQFFDEFIVDDKARKVVKHRCNTRLKTRKQEFFEFSEQSILSNLYWGIESIEAAIQAKSNTEERITRLKNAEKMLQVPALLSEDGSTAEIPNYYLVCSSYFYLSLVRKLQKDEWQVAIHFLQALLLSPVLVVEQFAPKLCTNIFESCIISVASAEEFKASTRLRNLMYDDGSTVSNIRCLRDILKESQSNTPISSTSPRTFQEV